MDLAWIAISKFYKTFLEHAFHDNLKSQTFAISITLTVDLFVENLKNIHIIETTDKEARVRLKCFMTLIPSILC